jgi:hypothetical protein
MIISEPSINIFVTKKQEIKISNHNWYFIIRENQTLRTHCTTPLFYLLAPTCFGSSLSSSGSFLDPSELPEIHIEFVIYLKYITDKKKSVFITYHVE